MVLLDLTQLDRIVREKFTDRITRNPWNKVYGGKAEHE